MARFLQRDNIRLMVFDEAGNQGAPLFPGGVVVPDIESHDAHGWPRSKEEL
jgi:hypothetical protein